MVTVHGSFVPYGATGIFFLWGLDPGVNPIPASGRAMRRHPQAVPVDKLYPVLRDVPSVSAVSPVIRLPGPNGLKPFKVPGICLSVPNAAQWLAHLDGAFAGTQRQPGPSLQVWGAAARFLLDLLGRGRFIPVLRAEAGVLTADWSLCAPGPEDAARMARLEAALPHVCRAIVPPGRDQRTYRPPASGELLSSFLQAAAGSLARLFLHGAQAPVPARDRPAAACFWLRALAGQGGPDLPAGLTDGAALFGAVDAWTAPVAQARSQATLRTGLRLLLPDDSPSGGWELELVLQTAGEPPLTIPAGVAWAAMGRDLTLGARRYRHAEQRLLADLPPMARLFPPLEPLLTCGVPERVPVDEAAVIALLEEGAAALQEAGFPVLLPAGLLRADALRPRLRIRPAGGVAGPRFGLSQMVEVQWDLALGGLSLGYADLQRLAGQQRALVQFGGRWVQVSRQSLTAALRKLGPPRQLTLGAALRLAPRSESIAADGWVADLLERLQEPATMEQVPLPRGFQGALRPYQQRGLDWLAFLRRYGLGACLADDMGLGKTVQLTALLLHERAQGLAHGPTLIVCPVSLVGNWRRELARFAPSLRVLVHHGATRTRGDALPEEAPRYDVVITTYALAARDCTGLAAVPWAGLVADEAQHLKNPDTGHARALRRLRAGYRVALTGTPVENHLGDLWSLFEFLNPGFLGGREDFRRQYALPIERDNDPEAAARLRRQVGPLILRRHKADPAIAGDLPEKLEQTVPVCLTVEQAGLYEAVVQDTLERAAAQEGMKRRGAVLAGLTRLKQVCNHPAALNHDGGPLGGRSGKLDRLMEMLAEVLAGGEAALVFTQFARFGARLQQYLQRSLGRPALLLDGKTPRQERDRLIARFQGGAAPIFVLSLKAGGTGLNLTAASHVFHFDRWWNPAVEDQATDRAYRIGQTRRVLVHRLVTAGTLEERIDRLLADKRRLSHRVIGSGEGWMGDLSTAELRDLIMLERGEYDHGLRAASRERVVGSAVAAARG